MGNHAGAPGDLQGPRCRMRGGGRNGPTRNSSGAVAADLWCSELKRGADGVKKHPCLSNYWPKPKHDKPHRFCKHPLAAALISRWTASLSHAAHARLRGQLARPRLLKPHQRGGKPAHPERGARRSTPPRHRSQPPSSPLLRSPGSLETDQ